MKPSPEKNPATARRRAAAEAQVEKLNQSRPPQSEADLRRLQHELEVHQIELQMQNDELRAAHAEINAGLERYTELFDFAPAGYFNLTADGTIRLVNLTGATLLDIPRAQLLGKRLQLLVATGDRKIFSDFLARIFAGSEHEVCRVQLVPEGRPPLFVRLDAKRALEGDRCRVVMVDITEHHQAEAALQTVTACNRVLERATSEPEMLREICRVIVEEEGYRMAWIGFPEADEKKSVRVVAHAGFEEGYLDKAKINWREDDARGQGPSGVAFRTGEIVVCNDFQTDPTTGPWRAEAQARGYGSSISLPLKYANESFGVMMIYAGQTKAFQNQERHLLAGLADDLSYGLNALRVAQRHAATEAALAASEARFRTLFNEHAAVQMVIDEETGTIVDANAAAARFYGWSVAQLKQMKVADINTQGEAAVRGVFRKVQTKEQFHFEFQHRRADGSIRDVEVFSNEMVIEGKPLLYSIIHDITERKQAELALNNERKLLRTLVDNLPLSIFLKDAAGRKVLANPVDVRNCRAASEAEILGKTDFEVLPPEQAADFTAVDAQVLAGQPVFNREEKIIRLDGKEHWFLTSKVPLRDAFGQITGLAGFGFDITERKQAEEKLRTLANRLELATRAGGVGIWEYEVADNRLIWDEQMFRLYGLTREQFGGVYESWQASLHPEDRRRGDEEIQAAQRGEKDYDTEFRVLWSDGSAHYIRALATVERDAAGQALRLVGTNWDITEQRQAEEKARRLAGELKLILDTAPIGIAWLKDRQVVTANLTHDKIYGYAPGETVCMPTRAFYADPQEYERVGRDGYATLARGEIFRTETLMRRKDGSVFPCSLTGQAINPQNLDDGSIWQLEDITERKRVETALQESYAFNDSLLQALPLGMEIVDKEGTILFQNAALEKVIGGKLTLGQKCWQVYCDNRQQCAECPLKEPIKVGETKTIEAAGVLGGKTFEITYTGMIYKGQPALLEVFHDITQRKQLEAEFRQAQKMEAVGQLAGGVAHDLNNILAAQYFEVDLLPMTEAVSPGVRKGLEHIRASAERAAKMVSQLLLFSRRQLMQMRDLDLNPVVANFSKLLRRLIGEQIQFEIHTYLEPLWIHADAGMIEQVLMNLALNARDAMPNGGKLLIETTVVTVAEGSEPPQREVQPGRYVCLCVSDTGTGIAPEVLPKIFEPFFTTKDVGKGSGLGLSSVDGIVKQHKGWIDVDNRPGEGVTFRIYFPALTLPAMESPPMQEPTPSLGGTETILLVEDDSSVSKLICRLLQQMGYVVLVAANGPEARKIWAEQRDKVALLLTDIIMPQEMSGLELAKQLLLEKPLLKVIYISGYSTEFTASKLDLREGVNFLQKPFVGQQLLKTIRENLDKPAKS